MSAALRSMLLCFEDDACKASLIGVWVTPLPVAYKMYLKSLETACNILICLTCSKQEPVDGV